MKTNSRDKQPPLAGQPNRLNKTQQPPGKGDYLNSTNNIQKKTTVYEKSGTERSILPPRAGSTQKINYRVEDNMTNSKIQEAKTGLNLLKKKMVRNGMSRERNERPTSIEKRQEDVYAPRKVAPKQEEYYGHQPQVKKPTPKPIQKREEVPKRSPPIPTKPTQNRPVRNQAPQEEYVNPNEQMPLNSNQKFMDILEKEMAKQNAKAQPQSRGQKKPVAYDQENEQIQLAQCSQGCGRKFNVKTIQKHEKVCQKVFQSKRKAFDSANHRQAENEGFKAPPPTIKEEKARNAKATKGKEQKIPKWKLQSAAFRAGLKAGRGEEPTAEEKAAEDSGRIQCPVCGRKFNQQAGKRHITFCQSKSKQLPKMNVSKKR